MSSSSQLPFELNQDSLTQWVERFNFSDPLASGHDLYKALALLKKQVSGIGFDELALCVDGLTPAAIPVIEFLQSELISGYEMLSVKQSKEARLSIAVLELMAFLNACLAKQVSDSDKQRHYCGASLQMLRLLGFHCALSHSRLPFDYWRTLAGIYRVCASADLLQSAVTPVFPGFDYSPAFESVLKCLLLFAVSHPLRFSRAELPVLYEFCIDHCGKVQFNRLGRYSREGFYWDFSEDRAPAPVFADSGRTGLLFNIDELLISARNREFTVEGFDAQTFWDGVTHYAAFAAKAYTPAMAVPCVFTRGYDQVNLFFQKHVRDGEVSRITSPSPAKIRLSTLELVYEQPKNKSAITHVLAEDIWGKPAESKIKKVRFAALKVFNSDRPNFMVIESIDSNLADEDLVALYLTDMAPKLAVIRRVEPVKLLNGNIRALLEIIPGEVSVDSAGLGAGAKPVLLLKRGKIIELIAASGQFHTGGGVELKQGSFRFRRLIEETDYFVRYLISAA